MSAPDSLIKSLPPLSSREFHQFSKLAYEHFGLDIRNGRLELIAARLGKIVRELQLGSFQNYYDYIEADRSGNALATMVDLLTTNHTSFFREPKHFEFLRSTVFPALRNRPQIHLWSAACSSGEEPYSIAMSLLEESREDALARVRIRASDISTRVLAKGKYGVYPVERCKELPPSLLQRYLLRGQGDFSGSLRFKEEVRSMVRFERLNLMDPLPEDYVCSVVFCRNLMIYFDRSTQEDLLYRLFDHVESGGYLFIGHSESLNNISHKFRYVCPAIYRKPGSLQSSPQKTPVSNPERPTPLTQPFAKFGKGIASAKGLVIGSTRGAS